MMITVEVQSIVDLDLEAEIMDVLFVGGILFVVEEVDLCQVLFLLEIDGAVELPLAPPLVVVGDLEAQVGHHLEAEAEQEAEVEAEAEQEVEQEVEAEAEVEVEA